MKNVFPLVEGMYGKGTSRADPFIFLHTGFKNSKEQAEVDALLKCAPVENILVKQPKRRPPPPPHATAPADSTLDFSEVKDNTNIETTVDACIKDGSIEVS